MSSRLSRAVPATVEDEDERGQPVSGTKHAAVASAVGGRPLQDTRSDSGYSSHTHRTLASADSAKALPLAPDPPAPELAPSPPVDIPAEIKPLTPDEPVDRPPSPSRKHRRASSKTSRLSRDRTSSRSSRSKPQRCYDSNCTELHYDTPVVLPRPPPSPHYHAHGRDELYDYYHRPPPDPYRQPPLPLPPSIEPSPADRALRRTSRNARALSYHEDMRRDLNLQFRTFAPGPDSRALVPSRDRPYYHHPAGYPFASAHEPYTLRDSYFDVPGERPPLRHAITDAPGSRRSYIDGSDSYHARMASYPHGIPITDMEARRRSFHGSLYPTMRPARSPERSPMYPPEQIPSPLYGSLPRYAERTVARDEDPRYRYLEYYSRDEPSLSPRERESSHRRQPSSAAYRDVYRPERSSRRSSFVSDERQSSRPVEYARRKSSSKSSVSPRRATEARSSRRPSHSTHREEVVQTVRRDSSQAQSPIDGKVSEANKYMDQTRGGPLEDDLATTIRQAYSTSTGKRPGLIAHRQPSVTSRTSSKSHHSHAKHSGGDTRSRSSRRNSDYHVRVQIVNDTNGEELQSYRLPMRDGRPVHFTVDEGGSLSRSKDAPRSEKHGASSSSSRWSWFTGGSRSGGRSRAGSDIDPDDRRGRRRLSIRSPIIEGPREGQAWGDPRAR